MTSLRRRARLGAQKFGIDLVRYPQSDPLWRVAQLLRSTGVDLVLDVGANDGGYATSIRQHGYGNRLISFEPLEAPFHALQEKAARVPEWEVMRCALGAQRDEVTINVAGNGGASSSLLPMLDRHVDAEPSSAYVGIEVVEMRTLDEIVTGTGDPKDRIFLKIDVQGFERAVLDGARSLLSSGRVVGLQMELSFVPLYDGGMTWQEGFDHAAALGMELMGLIPGFSEPSGRMLQADAMFVRPEFA